MLNLVNFLNRIKRNLPTYRLIEHKSICGLESILTCEQPGWSVAGWGGPCRGWEWSRLTRYLYRFDHCKAGDR